MVKVLARPLGVGPGLVEVVIPTSICAKSEMAMVKSSNVLDDLGRFLGEVMEVVLLVEVVEASVEATGGHRYVFHWCIGATGTTFLTCCVI